MVLDRLRDRPSNTRMLIGVIFVACGYLAGSLASAVIVCRLLGLADPRTAGSGNPGATNVLRLYGKRAAALTLVGDLLKGLLPVMAAGLLHADDWIIALTGTAAFIGHLFPLYFGFRGGKGVATLVGILIATHWLLGLAFVGTWLLAAAISRYSSVAALTAAALTPLYTWILLGAHAYVICFSVLAAVLIWKHRSNVRNLLDGTEDRIGTDAG
jgi:glycerol-3-phosphate acyltransferase PlsY